jgi:F0F1-type ATP synthase assembly protein I
MSEHGERPDSSSSWPEVMRALAPYMNIGWTFLVTIGLGLLGGHWVDKRFGTTPWFFILGAILGMGVGFYHFFKTVLRS